MKLNRPKFKKIILFIFGLFFAIFVFLIICLSYQKIKNLGNFEKMTLSSYDISSLTELANQFHSYGIQSFCVVDEGWYKMNGNDYKLNSDEYFYFSSPIGYEKLTYDQLLIRDQTSKVQFEYLVSSVKKYPWIKCIKEDVNILRSNAPTNSFAVNFESTYYTGYLYISDESIENNGNNEYIKQFFKTLNKIPNSFWYKYSNNK